MAQLALAVDDERTDREALLGLELGRVAAEELARRRRGDIGVVEAAEMVLDRGDSRDQAGAIGPERLAYELEAVAKPLRLDPQSVERRYVGPALDALVC